MLVYMFLSCSHSHRDHLLPLKEWGLFVGGYSFFAFVGLYLIGRVLNRVRPQFCHVDSYWYFIAFAGLCLFASVLLWCGYRYIGAQFVLSRIEWSLQTYSSPLVIVSSVLLFLGFAEICLTSSIVNRIALSVFAVFLAHCPAFYVKTIRGIAAYEKSSLVSLCKIVAFMVMIFAVAVVIDQIRIFVWKLVARKAFR